MTSSPISASSRGYGRTSRAREDTEGVFRSQLLSQQIASGATFVIYFHSRTITSLFRVMLAGALVLRWPTTSLLVAIFTSTWHLASCYARIGLCRRGPRVTNANASVT
jgi:hypothetical protein